MFSSHHVTPQQINGVVRRCSTLELMNFIELSWFESRGPVVPQGNGWNGAAALEHLEDAQPSEASRVQARMKSGSGRRA